jgi:hypothetical protein
MRRMIVVVVGIVFCVTPALAQNGTITIFADPGGADCALYDTLPNTLIQAFVFHVLTPGAFAAEFSVPIPSCAVGLTWLNDTHVFPVTLNDSPTGVGIGYGVCYAGPIHILTINYLGMGTSLNCCPLRVEPPWWGNPPDPPGVNTTDCNHNLVPANAGEAIINPDHTCPCSSVPTRDTTWGKVKALFAN